MFIVILLALHSEYKLLLRITRSDKSVRSLDFPKFHIVNARKDLALFCSKMHELYRHFKCYAFHDVVLAFDGETHLPIPVVLLGKGYSTTRSC